VLRQIFRCNLTLVRWHGTQPLWSDPSLDLVIPPVAERAIILALLPLSYRQLVIERFYRTLISTTLMFLSLSVGFESMHRDARSMCMESVSQGNVCREADLSAESAMFFVLLPLLVGMLVDVVKSQVIDPFSSDDHSFSSRGKQMLSKERFYAWLSSQCGDCPVLRPW
jgi:hypothetical protein